MSRKGLLALATTFGISALGFGQGVSLNFQSYDVSSAFSGTSVNRSGVVMGVYFDSALGTNYQTTWSASQGFKTVAALAGDNYQQKLSDSGNVYGTAGGKIIDWNATDGRQVIVGDASYSYSLVSSSDNDHLLIKGTNSTSTKYFTYSSNAGLQALNNVNASFTPMQVNSDGTVYGLVPGGSSTMFGSSSVFAKLNSNGSYRVDPRSVGNYSGSFMGSTGSATESFNFLPNGSLVVTTQTNLTQPGDTTYNTNYHIYNANGTDFQFGNTTDASHVGTSVSGQFMSAYLGNGVALGSFANQNTPYWFSASNQSGTALNASNFAIGSAVPNQILFGNDSVVVGQTITADGRQQLMISRVGSVPEPATLAVLGLGALGLIRRKK